MNFYIESATTVTVTCRLNPQENSVQVAEVVAEILERVPESILTLDVLENMSATIDIEGRICFQFEHTTGD